MEDYSLIVIALKQMFIKGTATMEKIDSLLERGTITPKEHDYIIGKEE